MDFLLRQYEKRDHAAVCDLHVRVLVATGAYIGSGHWDEDLNNIEAIYLQPGGDFLIVSHENRLIAMGALRRIDESCGEIKRMRVEPSFQGQGLGQRLLNALIERARELGYRKIVLDTTVKQIAAQRLYEKNGFTEVRRGSLGGFKTIYYERFL